jgi:hypothetical protein
MASFKLISEKRNDLYYKKYEYKVVFKIPHIGKTRYCKDYNKFKDRIDHLISKGWISFTFDAKRKNIFENFFLWKNKVNLAAISIRLGMHSLSVYSNDLEILKDTATYFQHNHPLYNQAIASTVEGIKYFKRTPPTNYRVYFKPGKVSDDFHNNLRDLLDRYKDSSIQFYPSKSLKFWMGRTVSWGSTWIRDTYNIGYNNESDYTILALTIPEILGKNFKLEKAIN